MRVASVNIFLFCNKSVPKNVPNNPKPLNCFFNIFFLIFLKQFFIFPVSILLYFIYMPQYAHETPLI